MTSQPQDGLLAGDWLSWSPETLAPSRWNDYVPFFAWIVERLGPSLAVELGSGSGTSFKPLCRVADRFAHKGRFVGIDSWRSDTSTFPDGDSVHDGLLEYCSTCHSQVASLLRMDPNEAVSQFEYDSIDLVHIAPRASDGGSSLDPSLWMSKLRPGGVFVLTCLDDHRPDEATTKIWQQLSECYPSVVLDLPRFIGLAQRPGDGIIDLVQPLKASTTASALFRSLGERIALRHVLGSEPLTGLGIQKHVAHVIATHKSEFRAAEARHHLAMEGLQEQLAATYDRLITKSLELGRIQNETDYLLAKLADQSARSERRTVELVATHSAEVRSLEDQLEALRRHAEFQEAEIKAIKRTVSWRLTRPLRVVQTVLLKLRRLTS